MRKSILPARLKRRHEKHEKADYDKVYEHPLDWCPLFGDLPEIEKTHLNNNKLAKSTARNCINIIHDARWYLGVFDDYHVQYARLPNVKELLFIYHGYGEACKAVRILFQNLDYLALKTANSHIVDTYYNLFRSSINDLKPGPIRNTPYNTLASNLLENVDVLKAPLGFESLLIYAEKITTYPFELERHHLSALYAILEAWLVLTSLIIHNKWTQEDIKGLSPFIDKAEKLLKASYSLALSDENIKLNNKDLLRNAKQSTRVKSRHEKEAAELQKRNEQWISDAKDKCKKLCDKGKRDTIRISEIALSIQKTDKNKKSIERISQIIAETVNNYKGGNTI